MFDSIPINVVICINKNNTKITSLISNITCAIIDCSNDLKKNQKKILFGKQECLLSCNESNNKYEYENTCYEKCPNGTYPDDNNICKIKNISLETKYEYITEDKTEYITKYITEDNNYISNSLKQIDSTFMPENNNENFYDYSSSFIGFNNNDELLNQIEGFIKDYSISEGKNIIIKGESNFIYQITTTNMEKELLNKNLSEKDYNVSIIDFTECEQLLKRENNLNENDSLIILKMEKLTNKTSERNIQYQIYEPINITLLNMSICKNSKIKVYIPFSLEGETLTLYQDLKDSGYDMFNKSDKFYNDICTPYTHYTGTDACLSAN